MEETKDSKPENSESTDSAQKEFCGFKSVEEFTENGKKLIVEATKAINSLPSGSSRDLYVAYSSYIKAIGVESEKILNVISNVIKLQGIKGNIVNRDKEEKFELLQECNDAMSERINLNLDELNGIKKTSETLVVTEVKSFQLPKKYILASAADKLGNEVHTAKLITAKNIIRPQVNFKTPVDNSNTPFVPRIKDKPWSLKPLAVLPEYDEDGNITSYLHPYEFEIEKFEPPAKQLTQVEPQEPRNITETPLDYIDTEVKLKDMVKELANSSEIAVDLEHHNFRTFQGITCLMQISSRSKDYIIDTIQLRDELWLLNEIFANPNIVKVLHGADSDIEWLQKDLSLYVVNMFDTHRAAKRLEYPKLSLAYLLKKYCNIDADKTFQLADWRMRPLPTELIKYAQQDTHYLLYIFDQLTNELLTQGNDQSNILKSVYQSSKEVCLKRYTKLMFTDESHKDLYVKSKKFFDNRQLFALKEIFAWRDKISRLEDESYAYVLPNHMLLQISESLPREMQGILACCNPIPPLVRQHLHDIHKIVLKARDQPLVKPMLPDQDRPRPAVNVREKKDIVNNPLYCPHDLSQYKEMRDDLPTLLGEKKFKENFDHLQLNQLSLSAFTKINNGKVSEVVHEMKFVTPYQRYKLMIPYLEELKRKEELLEQERRQKLANAAIVPLKAKPEESKKKLEDDIYKLPLKEMKKRKLEPADPEQPDGSPIVAKHVNKKRKLQQEIATTTVKPEVVPQLQLNESNQSIEDSPTTKKKKKKNKPQKMSDFRQSSNKPIAFDYSKVDYRKFQGGSTSGQQQQDNKDKIHLKNKKFKSGKTGKANAKSMNNMFSFADVRLPKSGKGQRK